MLSKKLFLSSIVLFVLVSLPLISSVGASSDIWSRTYGGKYEDVAYSVVETSDGGFALAGWRRPSLGEHSDLWLVKTDAYGNMEWNGTFGGIEEETAYSLVETSDGGFAAAGFTKSFGAGLADFWLVKTDFYGNMEWNKTYGGAKEDYANYMMITSDGGFALAGYTNSFGVDGFDFLMVKTDNYGNIEWYRTYGGLAYEKAIYLVEESDGGYVLAGTSSSSERDDIFWLVKIDRFGNMMWNKSIGLEMYSSVVKTSDGGFALYGGIVENIWSFSYTTWLIKTDAYGNVLWNQTYGSTYPESFPKYSLVETTDGGFAFAGGNRLNKTDACGNMEWSRIYNGIIHSLDITSNGGYVLAGEIPSETGRSDFWLIKTDQYGIIPEFPSWLILPLFLTVTLVVAIFRRKLSKTGKPAFILGDYT